MMPLLKTIFAKQSNSRVLKILIGTLQILLVLPPFLNQDHKSITECLLYLVVFITFTSLTALSLWTRLNTSSHIAALSIILDVLNTASISNVCMWFWYGAFKHKILGRTFTQSFYDTAKDGRKCCRIYLEVIFVCAYNAAFYIFDCHSWLQIESLVGYFTYVLEKWEYIYLHCTLLILCKIIGFVEKRFDKINSDLTQIISAKKHNTKTITGGHLDFMETQVKKSIRNYILGTKQIDLFNTLFGLPLFFLYLNILISFVLGSNNGFIFLNADTKTEEDIKTNRIIFALCFGYPTIGLVGGIKLTMACRSVVRKIVETGDLAFEALQEFSIVEDYGICYGVRRELVVFCKQLVDVQPFFTAAGFVTIDHTLLRDIANSIITYVIMLSQLNKLE